MQVVFLSAECAPFIKAGGLGDVVGSLPRALSSQGGSASGGEKIGIKPIIFLPLNKDVSAGKWTLKKTKQFEVEYDKKKEKVLVYKTTLPNSRAPVYFFSNKKYFDSEDAYSGGLKKFLFYSLASLQAMKELKIKPDIIHCHDHQTGLVANIIDSTYKQDRFFKKTKTVFTIHNLNYQGKQKPTILEKVDHDIEKLAPVVNDLKDGDINFMVQGIMSFDKITTVSPTYAKEILRPELGVGLDNILRKRKKDLRGIINGIDMDLFSPADDKYVKYNYDKESTDLKNQNKKWLQKKVGLPVDGQKALIGFVSRLVWQKGVDLITEEVVKSLDCQFVILGAGEERYHKHLRALAKKYPKKFSAQIKFSVAIAQQIYGAADMLLIPSRYEPCGLTQMIAMRYGTIPVVRATGGLRDTVHEFRMQNLKIKNKSNGFVFEKFNSKEMEKALQRALNLYYKKPPAWKRLQLNGMKKDFSWKKSAKEYMKLYKKL